MHTTGRTHAARADVLAQYVITPEGIWGRAGRGGLAPRTPTRRTLFGPPANFERASSPHPAEPRRASSAQSRLLIMQIEIDSTNATYGSDAIAYLCAKYDKDGNGKFDLDECAPRPLRTRVPLSLWGCMARPTLRRPTRLRRVRSIVTDLQKQT